MMQIIILVHVIFCIKQKKTKFIILFYFSSRIDATNETTSIAIYVNDAPDQNGNCKMSIVKVEKISHLCLSVKRKIQVCSTLNISIKISWQ